jgi:hypothetical protein
VPRISARAAQRDPDGAARQTEVAADVGGAQTEHVVGEPATGQDHLVPGVAAGRGKRNQRKQMPLQRGGDEHDAHERRSITLRLRRC